MDPLALSGVVVAASSAAAHLTLRSDAPLRDALGADPTAARRFTQGDTLNLFAEVYAGDARTRAEDVSVTAVVTTPAGREMKREAGWLDPLARAAETTGRWGVSIEVSLTDVEPGSYILTISAESAAHADQKPQRRIPFVVDE
jgi:hypothetical protein